MASVVLPDGVRDVPDGSTVAELAAGINPRLARIAIAARVDDRLVDLSHKLRGDIRAEILTEDHAESLAIMRHSTAHVLAQAVRRLYGADVQYTIGPAIEDGFYYDFQFPPGVSLSPEELPKIEAEMKKVIDANFPSEREEVTCEVARARMRGEGQRFKDEIITELEDKGERIVSLYRQGNFLDLCRGPHVPSTGRIKAFKLTSIAGAYWRGDAQRDQLTRIYGTAFFERGQLDEHLRAREEAKQRDHRVLGPHLGLFHLQEEGPGCVFWHDRGWTLWRIVENYVRDALRKHGYLEVRTPQILGRELWERSGHWEKYREVMFVTESEKHTFVVKPMNCPAHVEIFNQGLKSYRDLPLRLAEFGACHRNEPSGTLHGIMRVRAFTQDDAHIFCTEEQINAEVAAFVHLLHDVYRDFGFTRIVTALSTRPEKRIGSDAIWDQTEKALADAMDAMKMPYRLYPGEGAFYGPKLDFQVADALGRLWQLGTIQLDAILPGRLAAKYVGEDGGQHTPFMLHRAILGSLERFIGILVEQYAGAFPLWLAPVQVSVLPISDKFNAYGREVVEKLTAAGLRVDVNLRSDKIGAKIRNASLQKIRYMLVVGEKEQRSRMVAVRHRTRGDLGPGTVDAFVEQARAEVAEKRVS